MYVYIPGTQMTLVLSCFDWKGPCFGGLKPNNRGQIGSKYMAPSRGLLGAGHTKASIPGQCRGEE